jgi:hypothetical protein
MPAGAPAWVVRRASSCTERSHVARSPGERLRGRGSREQTALVGRPGPRGQASRPPDRRCHHGLRLRTPRHAGLQRVAVQRSGAVSEVPPLRAGRWRGGPLTFQRRRPPAESEDSSGHRRAQMGVRSQGHGGRLRAAPGAWQVWAQAAFRRSPRAPRRVRGGFGARHSGRHAPDNATADVARPWSTP